MKRLFEVIRWKNEDFKFADRRTIVEDDSVDHWDNIINNFEKSISAQIACRNGSVAVAIFKVDDGYAVCINVSGSLKKAENDALIKALDI